MQKNNEVIYQIFPRNYSKEGKFLNIINDLPRIKALGVDIIYLMPINSIGTLNRKGACGSPYASQDYFSISQDLGTLEDFNNLCQSIHHLGMKIILDMVFNHTAPDNVLIKEHPEFYFYKNNKRGNRIGNWSDIVDLDVDKEVTQTYLVSVLQYWIKQGVDGFRFDVASMIPLSFFKKARAALGPEIIFLGESIDPSFYHWLISQNYYASKDEDLVPTFDSLYNYHWFREFQGYLKYGDPLNRTIHTLNQSSSILRVNCLENHDNDRVASLVNGNRTKLKNLLAFSFFLSGIPFLYAGEEYAIEHKPELFEKDPIDWSKKDEEINEFVKHLIHLKHLDPSDHVQPCYLTQIGDNAIKIAKGNKIGFFNFGNAPLTIKLADKKYHDLLSNSDIINNIIDLVNPLILEDLKYEN
ncbi:MAG: alpha-amylase family glycosyl hydrolase [Bacilli bacterium]